MSLRNVLFICAALIIGMVIGVATGFRTGYIIGYETPIDATVCPR